MVNFEKFSIESFVFCDDCRREFNGKHILVGVYDDIIVRNFPAELTLSFWLQFNPKETGDVVLEFRLVGDHNQIFVHAKSNINIPRKVRGSLTVGQFLFPVYGRLKLSIEMRCDGGDWAVVKTIDVLSNDQIAED